MNFFRFLRRLFLSEYEWMAVCPDSDAGYTALHEELGNGWEYGFEWVEHYAGPATGLPLRSSHVFLRRRVWWT